MSKYNYVDVSFPNLTPPYSFLLNQYQTVPNGYQQIGTMQQYNSLKTKYNTDIAAKKAYAAKLAAEKAAKLAAKKKTEEEKSTLSVFNGKALAPPKMPAEEIQHIKNLQCPPPVKPTVANAKIMEINNAVRKQLSTIQILEKQVSDLEKRYKISFTSSEHPQFDLQSYELPRINITGNLTNIGLGFHLWGGRKGLQGVTGDQGNAGTSSYTGTTGATGVTGYYGIKGDSLK